MSSASNASAPARPLPADGDAAGRPAETMAATAWPHWLLLDRLLITAAILLSIATAVVVSIGSAHQRRLDQAAAEFRALSAALTAASAAGEVPDDRGFIPASVRRRLDRIDFTVPTPLGGNYRWRQLPPSAREPGTAAAPSVLVIEAFPPAAPMVAPLEDLQALDRALDDGDPDTGRFRQGFLGWPQLAIEEPAP